MATSSTVAAPETETPLSKRHAKVLRAVTAINTIMFVVEAATGYFAHSVAMMSDSIDMLGDALGAGTGALVRNSSPRKQAWVALAKAGFSSIIGLSVLGGAAFLLFNPVMPVVATMGIVGGLAFAANALCVTLLYKHRNDNINLKATWKCTRNDMVSNAGVLTAAVLSHFLLTPIPDIVVGALVSVLCIKSSISIARDAIRILRAPENRKKKDVDAPAVSPQKPEPKNASRFKKILCVVFNRTAAKTQAPVVVPAINAAVKKMPEAANDDAPASKITIKKAAPAV